MADLVEMTSETIAGELFSLLVRELKTLPEVWARIPEYEQTEILERVKKRVLDNTRQAVKLVAAAERLTVAGELKRVTFSDKIEAVFAFGKQDPNAMELCHAQGMACLIVTLGADRHLGGTDEVKPDPDQPDLPGVGENGAAAQVIEQARRRSKRKPPAEGDAAQEPPLH